jgi:putative chitinase
MLTSSQLKEIMPKCPPAHLEKYTADVWSAMQQGQIITLLRASAFFGQIAVESGDLRFMREIWSPDKVEAQRSYERDFLAAWPPTAQDPRNRKAHRLGNSEKGDGFLFRGWGPIQNTGRGNTFKASMELFGDDRLVKRPALLDDSAIGFLGAKWYWTSRNLNPKADVMDFKGITFDINGGYTHYDLRVDAYLRALAVLGRASLPNILL